MPSWDFLTKKKSYWKLNVENVAWNFQNQKECFATWLKHIQRKNQVVIVDTGQKEFSLSEFSLVEDLVFFNSFLKGWWRYNRTTSTDYPMSVKWNQWIAQKGLWQKLLFTEAQLQYYCLLCSGYLLKISMILLLLQSFSMLQLQ